MPLDTNDLNSNPPEWLQNVVANMQANQDNVYHNALAVYNAGCASWVANNVLNRDLGRPLTAPPTIPIRQIIYATTSNSLGQYSAPVDPTIPIPVLPPPVPITPSAPILGPGSTNPGSSVTLDQVYALLKKIAGVMNIT